MITAPGNLTVQPGDFAAVRVKGGVGRLIHLGEILNGDGFGDFEHAIFYAGGPDDLILEAEPGGAKLIPYHYQPVNVLWSTVNPKLNLSQAQRGLAMSVAEKHKGVPYSFLDYAALAAHRLRIPAPGLKDYIGDTGHEICSMLVDSCRLDMGSRLFVNPPRWRGYVTPLDLANLISG